MCLLCIWFGHAAAFVGICECCASRLCFMADYARVCPLDVCERNIGHAAGSSGGL